jgi:hypothetical protein
MAAIQVDVGYARPEDLRIALDLDPDSPMILCDARQCESVKTRLIALVRHAIAKTSARSEYQPRTPPAGPRGREQHMGGQQAECTGRRQLTPRVTSEDNRL